MSISRDMPYGTLITGDFVDPLGSVFELTLMRDAHIWKLHTGASDMYEALQAMLEQ